MATQRVTLAKIGGRSATIVSGRFRRWYDASQDRSDIIQVEVDAFAHELRAHAHQPPVVYFAEWADMWSMGDLLPNLGNESVPIIQGKRYQACCHSIPASFTTSTIAGEPSQESQWLRQRLTEAEDSWQELTPHSVIVVLREVLGGLVTDEELSASLDKVPPWLESFT